MAIIGTFTQRDAQFIGTVRTLILNEEITLIPIEKNSEAAPDYRAGAGRGRRFDCARAGRSARARTGGQFSRRNRA